MFAGVPSVDKNSIVSLLIKIVVDKRLIYQ
jgi:hypothetical protein